MYFKLTNLNENHHGITFKDELNVDNMPFSSNQECTPGGIYFCQEQDIHKWLLYNESTGLIMCMRRVTIPEGAHFQELNDHQNFKADRIIMSPRERIPDHYYIHAIQCGDLFPSICLNRLDIQSIFSMYGCSTKV